MVHKWAKSLHHPCPLEDPHRFRAGGKIRGGPKKGKVATSPLPSRGSHRFIAGGKIRSAPQKGKVATSPRRLGDPHRLRAGGKIRSGPQVGQRATLPAAVSGIPTASERGAKSEVAHKRAKWLRHPCRPGFPTASEQGGKSRVAHNWAKWLRHPCRLRVPHRFKAGGKIKSGPLVGKVATSPLPSRGSPPLQSGGGESEVVHKWAKSLHHPCHLEDPHRFRAGGKIRSGPQKGKVATSPLPSRGSPPLHSGGQNQKHPTKGQSGYVTPAVSGTPTACERGAKSEVAHKWAKGLRHPCRLGDPHCFRAGGKIRSGPQKGKVATSPLPSRGSPPLQSRGGNQEWPTSGQSGYVTPAVSGIPTASKRGAKSKVAHLWAKWLRHPCRLGDPHRFKAGAANQKWSTIGQSRYITPAFSRIPTASEQGAKSEVAHKKAKWLRHPCHLADPHRFIAGDKIRSTPQKGKVATSPLPSPGSPPLQSGGQNQNWPNYRQSGYVTPAVSGIPTA